MKKDYNEHVKNIIRRADKYLEHWGKKKHMSWFDMSHLLSYLIPELTKEQILEIYTDQYCKENNIKRNKVI